MSSSNSKNFTLIVVMVVVVVFIFLFVLLNNNLNNTIHTDIKEIGVEDNKNAYILNFDCSNVKEIVDKINNVPEFKFKKLKDNYNTLFTKDKSNYKGQSKVTVRCKVNYYDDLQLNRKIFLNEIFKVDRLRADELVKAKVCEIIKE